MLLPIEIKKRMLLWMIITVPIFGWTQTKTPSVDNLYNTFVKPNNTAKPRVWWHWMNGNITQEGIRKDLEWMHQTGIGGFQNFDAALMTPQIVKNRLVYMTPEWQSAFKFTTKLADSLGLEMAIAASPGWSESGGPWVKPEDGMKKIVWIETPATAGTMQIKITTPANTTGPFQNIPKPLGIAETELPKNPPIFYKDIAIIAYKLPDVEISLKALNPVISSSGGNFTLNQLTDGDLSVTNLLPVDTVGFAWIQFAFAQPQTIYGITMMGGGDKGPFGMFGELADTRSLETSNDGKNFKWICYIPAGSVLQQTIAIPPTIAKYFRITVKNPPPKINFMATMSGKKEPPTPALGTDIAELVLYTAPRIHHFEEKAAFAPAIGLLEKPTPATDIVIPIKNVVDITDKLAADGTLLWTIPAGNWHILRFGYSLLGINNHPASPEATGLEVDKLDPAAIRRYFTHYLNQYQSATGGLMGSKGGLQYIVTDSWEAGAQNWTHNMLSAFQQRRGYSMLPWMPVLTGRIVESAAASENFLFDFRKTLSELVAEYHYDGLTKLLAERGMKRYSESHESGRALIADGMDVKRSAAVPMSAMWTPEWSGSQTMYEADIRESASTAHIYGQNLVAAESLTAFGLGGNAWAYDPARLKPTADLELANGLNRFVIHTSVHQPVEDKIPGLGLGPFGQWFTRHETWAPQAKAWTDYLSRSSYLLQQGKFVADILYYYGEDNNITALFGNKPPAIPEGYNFDYINTDALLRLVSVKDGKLITPSGMQYRVLVLDTNARKMTLPVLRKLKTLVQAGAVVTGVKPTASPSLSDDIVAYNTLINEIWTPENHAVLTKKPLATVLTEHSVLPDFSYNKPTVDTKILFVHRSLPDQDIYWINNRKDRTENIEAIFRTAGKIPELWHPETGKKQPLSYEITHGITKIPLQLQPNEAVFIIFKNKATKLAIKLPILVEKPLATLNENWDLHFQKDRGAPAGSIKMDSLQSWTKNTIAGIKYFSGTATYTKTIEVPADWLKKDRALWIDLGEVKNLAEVFINRKSLGILWKKPFKIDATKALQVGKNKIEIKVTNLWVNRLIGDEQPNVEKKITYTTMPFYQADAPLLPSGLLESVKIIALEK